MELFIGISARWENGTVEGRPKILSVMNEKTSQIDSEEKFYGNRESVLEVFKSIKAEKDPTFQFVWTPPDNYKSTFLNLKNKKLSEFTFTVFIKDSGTVRWTTTATAEGAEVKNVMPSSRGQTKTEKVYIKCKKFDFNPGKDMNVNVP